MEHVDNILINVISIKAMDDLVLRRRVEHSLYAIGFEK
jgi:hypothetical protein